MQWHVPYFPVRFAGEQRGPGVHCIFSRKSLRNDRIDKFLVLSGRFMLHPGHIHGTVGLGHCIFHLTQWKVATRSCKPSISMHEHSISSKLCPAGTFHCEILLFGICGFLSKVKEVFEPCCNLSKHVQSFRILSYSFSRKFDRLLHVGGVACSVN